MSFENDFEERMLSYYPTIISSILEFQAIIKTESIELDSFNNHKESTINSAYLYTMSEERVKQWEKILKIKPIDGSSLDDRRETIIARIRGQGKLNRTLINTIVNTFTNGTAESWIENGVLHVTITPPPNNKQYQFANVEQEIANKLPAHLGLEVSRAYATWGDIKSTFSTWSDVQENLENWENVYLYVAPRSVQLYGG